MKFVVRSIDNGHWFFSPVTTRRFLRPIHFWPDHNCLLASCAPSRKAWNFAQTTVG